MFLSLLGLQISSKKKEVLNPYGKDYFPVSRSFLGMGGSGRYVHATKQGRATYHPAYYTIDGRLLEPRC